MRFVACYSDKPRGEAAIKLCQKHAGKWQAEIDVVWAISRDQPFEHKKLRETERELEDHVAQLFQDSDVPYKVHLLVDDVEAGEQIVHFAQRSRADMIFLGLKKRSLVGKMLFGSNAQDIVLNAPCPVLTVRRDMESLES